MRRTGSNLDIHVMLRGEERIDLNFIRNMKQGEFVPEDDFLPLEGSAAGHALCCSRETF